MEKTFVSNLTIKRLAKDVRDILRSPLDSHNIYYKHDEEDMLKGYALIIGSEGTPYYLGCYFFEFNFPADYPHSPPQLLFRTTARTNNIRFNPNLYYCGKVCLSLLNTWRGDQWSSCQTITTVLLTLASSVFCSQPFLNEPGMGLSSSDFDSYEKIIEFANIDTAILDAADSCSHLYRNHKTLKWKMYFFDAVIKSHMLENAEKIRKRICDLERSAMSPKLYHTDIYGMHIMVDYDRLKTKLSPLLSQLLSQLVPEASSSCLKEGGREGRES